MSVSLHPGPKSELASFLFTVSLTGWEGTRSGQSQGRDVLSQKRPVDHDGHLQRPARSSITAGEDPGSCILKLPGNSNVQ